MFVKVGYFRSRDTVADTCSYVSYAEFNSWSMDAKLAFKEKADMGRYKLSCACCIDEDLELVLTASGVVRVAKNGNQERHMESCPKSIYYSSWAEASQKGLQSNEDSQLLFHISLPSVFPQKSSSSSSSSGSGTGTPREKKTSLYDMVVMINKIAWEKQTFSKKKEIREANKEGKKPSWQFKDVDEFNRLFFGICNDLYCKCQGEVLSLIHLCYRKDAFYNCNDWRRQWLFYAVIEKVSEFKASRKYQYVTVRMPSDKSGKKAVIRVLSEDYETLFENYQDNLPGVHNILAGYISRRVFKGQDGSVNEWMNLIKGVVLQVSENGLFCENAYVANTANALSTRHIIFKRPYLPLENYGSETPSFLIERLNGKNIIIDCPDESSYERRCSYGAQNDEFDCLCFKQGEDYLQKIMDLITK